MESHLLQMRGLKHQIIDKIFGRFQSHLLQMRGLKPRHKRQKYYHHYVASFTDAWIETSG